MKWIRFRFFLLCASAVGALVMAGCVTTGGQPRDGSASSGSGITVYGTVDVGVSK